MKIIESYKCQRVVKEVQNQTTEEITSVVSDKYKDIYK